MESGSQIRAAILTVSDTASADASADKSGPAIKEILEDRGFVVNSPVILPDDEHQIQAVIKEWSAQGDVDLIVTTGGTGFGVRDRTPEAISPLIERDAPGLVHLLLSTSLKHTPLAALSRPVAGTIRNTLVVTLPGSVKAVRESLEALTSGGVIDHAIELIRGGSGKGVHAALALSHSSKAIPVAAELDRHHHHHHGHSHSTPQPRTILSHDPSLPASARHRKSPYPLISFHQAIGSILKEVTPLKPIKLPVTSALKGYVLAEDVYASQYVPLSPTTSVDGYALRSTDSPGIYKVLTSETHPLSSFLPFGSIYQINTGGYIPTGADTVIMVEDTRLSAAFKSADGYDIEEKEVETLVQVPGGENIRAAGSDVRKGDLVLQRGEIIRSAGGEIGTLIFVGTKEVEVYKKPVVGLLSTGNEIVDLHLHNHGDLPGGTWDTNRPSLQAALEGLGYEVVDLGIVPDELAAHVVAIKDGLQRADILLTTGGTSMGATDLLKPVIEHHLGGSIHFGRVAVKPGKPTTFATIPCQEGVSKPIFALPGNPASALVTFQLFVVPALRKLGSWPTESCQLPRIQVQIQDAMNLDSRTEFHRVTIRAEKDGLKAYSTGGQRSSRVASLSGANGLVVLPQRSVNGPEKLKVGEYAEAIVIGEIQM